MDLKTAASVLLAPIQYIFGFCYQEFSQIQSLDKDATKLTATLDTIQKLLNDAEARTIPSDAIKSRLKKLEDVAFDAANVLDELKYHLLSKQIEHTEMTMTMTMMEKVLSCCSSRYDSIAQSRNMALRIKEINENLESINKEATELGLNVNLADVPVLVITALETDSYSRDPIFIGRDNVVSEIVELLTNSITTDERAASIISIVGMGGLGKTTLTRKVFNRLKNKTRFGSHIWVHVSRNFDAITLLKKILKNLTSCQVENMSKEDILAKLKEALKAKTYLLVLDDVWNEDTSKWEDFINSLLGVSSVKGNAIVVTTRSMEVDSIVNPLHTHKLEGLSEEECWSIIEVKTFGEGNVPSEFEAIGRKIARRCRGLPLAANVVGGVLRNKDEEKWLSIEDKWLSPDEGRDDITNILRLSFDNLSLPSLKKCFAYCAMYPKGCKIMKQELIEFWMAEGFLQADERDEMESVGEKFINVLLHNSLLQVSERDDDGNIESCGMHDLVHDLACSVSSSSNSTSGSSRVRYMILDDGKIPSGISKEMAKSLRTLLLISSKGDISGIEFSDLESLHVLRLDAYRVKELPSLIQKLIHLRDLDIPRTSIEYLPDWIGEFFHLQTLRANSEYLKKLPSTIKYLINLRHLYIDSRVELPMGIGRLTSLQTLTHFPVGDENGCKIEELGSLINLKGELCIGHLERVHDKEEAGKANLFKKSKILKLCLTWNGGRREGETNDENVLEGLQPHSHLRELKISGFNGKRFPSWTQKMAVRDAPRGSWVLLNKLKSLILWNCKECEEIPMLGQLPNLKSLVLWGMPKLAEWAEIEISDGSEVKLFPRLQHLEIKYCEQLMNVPSLGHLPNLKSLRLEGLRNLKCINSSFYRMVNNDTRIVFPALEDLILRYMPKLAEWAEIEISDESEVKLFPRLQHLEIKNCEQLMNVPSSGHLPNLKSLKLYGWKNVKCINSSFYGMVNKDTRIVFPALEQLILRGMPELAEWAEIEISDGSEVKLFPRLQLLEIDDCPQLMSVPSLGHLPNLKSLRLERLRNLKCINSSFYGMVNKDTRIVFPALEKLTLYQMPELAEWAEIEISDGSEVKLFPRLQYLTIIGCKQLMSVPSHVSSCLEELIIREIGVECLPADWLLSNSETLSELYIVECPNLREISDRWGEEESEGRSFTITSLPIFPRLTKLIIDRIPKLSLETVDAMRRLEVNGYKRIDHDGKVKPEETERNQVKQ